MQEEAGGENQEKPDRVARDLLGFIAAHQPLKQERSGERSQAGDEQRGRNVVADKESCQPNEPRVKRKKNERNTTVTGRDITVLRKGKVVPGIPVIPDLKPAPMLRPHRGDGLHAISQEERLDPKNKENGFPVPATNPRKPMTAAGFASGSRRLHKRRFHPPAW